MTQAIAQKARGAFFTPPEISQFLVNWAIRSSSDRVLEPSCGDAAFLIPAAGRLKGLGANQIAKQLYGIDIGDVPGCVEFLKRSALPTLSR